MYSRRFRGIVVGLVTMALFLSSGCTVDVGAAARSSFSSFVNTLASSVINSAINP